MALNIHKANQRGVAEHGWLHSHFSFSFAEYYNKERMGFGALRVINDDIVEQIKKIETLTFKEIGEVSDYFMK